MIYTLTLNPALDITISIDVLKKGSINPTELRSVSAGGKGFNTSRALNCLGSENTAIAFCGGFFTGNIKKLLEEEKIKFHLINIEDNTRANIKVIEEQTEDLIELNGKGPLILQGDVEALMDYLEKISAIPGYFILSGSLPQGVDVKIYSHIINTLKPNGMKTLLDASGEALYHGISAIPDILKINQYELSAVSEKYFKKDPEEVIRDMLFKGIKIVMITSGSDKILYFDQSCSYSIIPPDIKGPYKTGAGDSVNAGIVHALQKDYSTADMLKLAVACGNANILSKIPGRFEIQQVKEIKDRIKLIRTS